MEATDDGVDRDVDRDDDDDPRRPMPDGLRRVFARISAIERAAGAIILGVLLVLVLVQTATRFLPVGGWVWTGELARFCLVWMTFAVSGRLMARDRHISLDLVDFATEGRPKWIARAFANVVVAVVCLGFVVESVAMVTDSTSQTTPAMQLPLQLVYVIPLLGFALTGVRAALAVVWRPPASAPGEDGTDLDDDAPIAAGRSTI